MTPPKTVTIPEGLSIEDRLPRVGEVGWTVYKDETPEQWLEDVVKGCEPDSDAPGGYGWICDAAQAAAEAEIDARATRLAYDGREVKTVTVIYRPPLSPEASQLLSSVLLACEEHGKEEDPDHEIGDLQQLVMFLARECGSEGTARAITAFLEMTDLPLPFCADCGGSTAIGTPDPHVCGQEG